MDYLLPAMPAGTVRPFLLQPILLVWKRPNEFL